MLDDVGAHPGVYCWEDSRNSCRAWSSDRQNVRCRTVMSGTGQRAGEMTVSKRYEALLRVSQTLISVRSWEKLLSILARELRAVANFCYLGVAIYDEKALRAADRFTGREKRRRELALLQREMAAGHRAEAGR